MTKNNLLLKLFGLVTLILFVVGLVAKSRQVGFVALLLFGFTFLVYIYTVTVKSWHSGGPADILGNGAFHAYRGKNPLGFWTIIVLETIASVLIIGVALFDLIAL